MNGRWAMAAVAGILFTELVGLPNWWEAGAQVRHCAGSSSWLALAGWPLQKASVGRCRPGSTREAASAMAAAMPAAVTAVCSSMGPHARETLRAAQH
jgi:hypothetical protein